MKTLRTPYGTVVKVSDEGAKILLANGYELEPVKETPKPAPKAPAKKAPAKKADPKKEA